LHIDLSRLGRVTGRRTPTPWKTFYARPMSWCLPT
jgi:hypothetical protein